MNVFEFSQEIDQFFRQRDKKSLYQQEKSIRGDRLSNQLLEHFDETSLRALAFDCGMMPQDIEGHSYGRIAQKLQSFVLNSGQWDLFRVRLETERPLVPWVDTISKSSPFLPLRPEEINEYPKDLQLALLLTQHFSMWELGNLANRLDNTIDWQYPPYTNNQTQFTAVLVYYLVSQQKVSQLLQLMKQTRPLVAAIQQFTWEDSNSILAVKRPEELFVETGATPVPQTVQTSFSKLVELLAQNFTWLDLEEMCFDVGIQYDRFAGRTIREKINTIVNFLEKLTFDHPVSKAFIAACINNRPTINWLEVVGLGKESIPPIESVGSDGFYLFRIRKLMQRCLPENTSTFDFVQRHDLRLRDSMSNEWLPEQNRLTIVDALKRRGLLPDLLAILENEYPQQYGLFAPYTKSE